MTWSSPARWTNKTIKIRRPASALSEKLLCPPGPWGPAAVGHDNFSDSVLEGLLYFISPHLGSKGIYFDNLK